MDIRDFKFKFSGLTQRLLLGYLVVVMLIMVIIVIADINMARTQRAIETSTDHFVPQMIMAADIKSIVLEQLILARNIVSGDDGAKKEYRNLDRAFLAKIRDFEAMHPEEETLLIVRQLKRDHDNFNLVANHIFKYQEAGRLELVETLWKNYKLACDKMIDTADKLVVSSGLGVQKAQEDSQNILVFSRQFMYTVALFSLIFCFILTYFSSASISNPLAGIIRASTDIAGGNLTERLADNPVEEFSVLAHSFNKMVDNLQMVIKKLIDSSGEVAKASMSLERHAQRGATAYDTINAAIKEMSHGARQQSHGITKLKQSASTTATAVENITDSVQIVGEITSSAANLASTGGESVKKAVEQIEQIEKKVAYLSSDVSKLDHDIRRISEIINTISRFAKQTNLLALNASIEAARAGIHGKSFAVVAENIHKLAVESGDLAGKIGKIISNIQERSNATVGSMEEGKRAVENGVVVINETGVVLNKIIDSVCEASVQVGQVLANIEQIAVSSENVVREITENGIIAEKTVETASRMLKIVDTQVQAGNELIEAATKLTKMANHLQEVVANFKVK